MHVTLYHACIHYIQYLQIPFPSLPAIQCPYKPASSPCSKLNTTVGPGDSTTEFGDATYLSASLSLILFVSVIALAGIN